MCHNIVNSYANDKTRDIFMFLDTWPKINITFICQFHQVIIIKHIYIDYYHKRDQLQYVISLSMHTQMTKPLIYSCSWTCHRSWILHSFINSIKSSSSNRSIWIVIAREYFKTRATSMCHNIVNAYANDKTIDRFTFLNTWPELNIWFISRLHQVFIIK